jgi:LmbE family N-acetylglucosaminyl deacetylase
MPHLPPPELPRAAVFVSPHFDDVVLSCGGTVAMLIANGVRPTVVTVFGGEITDEAMSTFAKWKHSRWGIESIDDVLDTRRNEEARAAATLGYYARALGFPDAIYRGDRYSADLELYAIPNAQETGLEQLIADEVRSLPEWTDETVVYVPLAAGDHVDHQIAHEAGQIIARAGVTVYAYEDCPYSIHTPSGVTRRVAALGGRIGPEVVVTVGASIEQRVEAIAQYTTQVPVIFRYTDDWAGSVREHACEVGGPAGPAERFWPVLGAPQVVLPDHRRPGERQHVLE